MAESISAAAAGAHFFNSLDAEKARNERPEVDRFIEWFGADKPMAGLRAGDVTAYEEREREQIGHDDLGHLEPLRAFLAYCSRLAFTDANLVPSLHLPPGAGGGARGGDAVDELGGRAYFVTREGLGALELEVEELKARRPDMADQLRTAMADKDFRENAPLDAARDTQAHLEARIRAIEDHLRHAVIIDPDGKHGTANVGSTVRVLNLKANREQTFHLVSSNEVDPAKGKISVESPVGRAVKDHGPGDEVTVRAPAGELQLRVLEVIG
ncbi:MAG: transcription elongation factor GreA [Dehalococcoidia bacterium]|nr:transcription elongation factor GreA [Dehalococcoidia bacterium]